MGIVLPSDFQIGDRIKINPAAIDGAVEGIDLTKPIEATIKSVRFEDGGVFYWVMADGINDRKFYLADVENEHVSAADVAPVNDSAE